MGCIPTVRQAMIFSLLGFSVRLSRLNYVLLNYNWDVIYNSQLCYLYSSPSLKYLGNPVYMALFHKCL